MERWFDLAYALRDVRGNTAIEYALVAALVGVALVGALFVFQGELWNIYVTGITNNLKEALD